VDADSLIPDPDTEPDPAFQVKSGSRGLMTKNWKNNSWKKLIFVQFTFTSASLKDVQATGEAFRPKKRTSNTSKN
jgi:hypothetical protein